MPPPASDATQLHVGMEIDPRLERLLDAMGDAAEAIFRDLVATLDLARHRSHVDIGGGNGLLSCLLAAREPRLASTTCDLPEISAVAERRIRARGLAGRVRARSLDPYAAEFPAADLVTMAHLLHDWHVQRRKMLIAKAWRALAPGGVFVAIETIVDPARTPDATLADPTPGLLIEFGDALDFGGGDLMRWCREIGFGRCEVSTLAGGTRAVVACK